MLLVEEYYNVAKQATSEGRITTRQQCYSEIAD